MTTCQDCSFAETMKAQPTDLGGQLVCRRFPPTVTVCVLPVEGLDGRVTFKPQSFPAFPTVAPDVSCGEFLSRVVSLRGE